MSFSIYLLDDDPTERLLWELLLKKQDPSVFVKTFSTSTYFCQKFEQAAATVAVVDLVLDLDSGIHTCVWLKENYPETKVFVNTSFDITAPEVIQAVCSASYLSKEQRMEERVSAVLTFIKSKRSEGRASAENSLL